jgi:hydrogenase nickel incorporation protein HypA/HybF
MHEMGIIQEVLVAVDSAAREAGAIRVTCVRLTIGELTEIVPDALQFAWEALTPGTLSGGAILQIEQTTGRSRCCDCATEFEHDRFDRRCPACGSFLVEVLSGRELMIDGVEVDLPEDGG